MLAGEDSEIATSLPLLPLRHVRVLERRRNYLRDLGAEGNSFDRAETLALTHALAVVAELRKQRFEQGDPE